MRLQPHDTTVFDGDPMRALHEPVCTGITGAYMTWRGFQRPGSADTPAFMQEWLVEILRQP